MSSPHARREHDEPIREQVDAIRDELEAMLLRMPEGAAEGAIRDASGCLTRLIERSADDETVIADVDAFTAAVRRARGALPDDGEEELLAEVERQAAPLRAQLLDQLASLPVAGSRPVLLPFSASVGVPAIFELPFVPNPEILALRPAWDAPADASIPADDGVPSLEKPPAALPRKEIEGLGRDALEDIGILGGLRRLYETEPWSSASSFEERLLANLDLLFSLDRPFHPDTPALVVPAAAWRYATEWSVPDWGRSFALAVSLGCARGAAALRWVVLALRRAPELVHGAFVDGLVLGSSPEVDRAITDLLRDAPAPVLVSALRVARRRGVFSAGAVVPLLAHPDELVAIEAIGCLRHAPQPLARELCSRLRASGGPHVEMAVLRELLLHGDNGARAALRVMLEDAERDRVPAELGLEALRLLALLGDPADEARVLAAATAHGREHLLGFYGSPDHFPVLWAALEKERMGGALESPKRLRLEAAVSRMTGLDASADPQAVLRAATERLGPLRGKRARAGRAYDPRLVLDELAAPTARQGERRDLATEIAMAAPELPRLDPDTWLSKQRADIQAMRDALASSRGA